MTDTVLYLDDLNVGDEFTSQGHTLDKDAVFAFAGQFDPQPFHLDEAAAQASSFGGLAASGWHTASVTMKLLVSSFPVAGGVLGLGAEVTWPRPVRPGDTLRAVTTVMEVTPSRSKPDRGIVTIETLTFNQDDELCQRMVSKVVATRRPS